jgi:hypothetical protein
MLSDRRNTKARCFLAKALNTQLAADQVAAEAALCKSGGALWPARPSRAMPRLDLGH